MRGYPWQIIDSSEAEWCSCQSELRMATTTTVQSATSSAGLCRLGAGTIISISFSCDGHPMSIQWRLPWAQIAGSACAARGDRPKPVVSVTT